MDNESDDDWDFKFIERLKKAVIKSKKDASVGSVRNKRSIVCASQQNKSSDKSSKYNISSSSQSSNSLTASSQDTPSDNMHSHDRIKVSKHSEPKSKKRRKDLGLQTSDKSQSSKETTNFDCTGKSSIDKEVTSKKTKYDKTKRKVERKLSSSDTDSFTCAPHSQNNKKKRKLKTKEKHTPSKSKSKTKGMKTPPVRQIHKGHCPYCQMPFAALIIQSPNWHTTECMDLPIIASTECPDGLKCDSTLPSHYRRFSHTKLAQSRSKATSDASKDETNYQLPMSENFTKLLKSPSSDLLKRTADVLDHFVPPQSLMPSGSINVTLNFDKKTINITCTPPSKGESSNSHRNVFHKTQQHSKSKRNIGKQFSDSQGSEVDRHVKPSTCLTAASSQNKHRQRDLKKKYGRGSSKINYAAGDKRRPASNLIPDGESETCQDRSEKMTDFDSEEMQDPLRLLMESDSERDSLEKDDGMNNDDDDVNNDDYAMDNNDDHFHHDMDNNDDLIHHNDNLMDNDDDCFDEDGGDKPSGIQPRTTLFLNRPDSIASRILSSPEADNVVQDFDDDLDCSDIETPEMLEDGSIKVQESQKEKFVFPDNPQVSAKDRELLAASEISGNNYTILKQKKMIKQKRSVGISGESCVSSSLNTTKQKSIFSFFKRKEYKTTTSTCCKEERSQTEMAGHYSCKVSSETTMTRSQSRSASFTGRSVHAVVKSLPTASASSQSVQESSSSQSTSEYLISKPKTKPTMSATAAVSFVQNPKERTGGRKFSCPFYKKIPDTSITVDAFRYGNIPGCRAYVLTHFHYDHYGGLTKHFNQPLYCSKITGNLVKTKIKVDDQYIHTLPMNQTCVVDNVELTLMEANHCPGAVILLFRLRDGRVFLHTGDFRACPEMEEYSPLAGVKIDQLYLDTTYCDPAYIFPSQKEVINFAKHLVQKAVRQNSRTLIVCGTYTIGKEKIFLAIAEAINSKIGVARDKKVILDCLDNEQLSKRITLQLNDSQLHVLPMGKLKVQDLANHLSHYKQFNQILALEPTGWTHSNKIISLDHIRPKYCKAGITIYGIPYSEHSSYLEMKRFTQFVRPGKILATVNNGNPQSRKIMEGHFSSWMEELDNPSPVNSLSQSSINNWL